MKLDDLFNACQQRGLRVTFFCSPRADDPWWYCKLNQPWAFTDGYTGEPYHGAGLTPEIALEDAIIKVFTKLCPLDGIVDSPIIQTEEQLGGLKNNLPGADLRDTTGFVEGFHFGVAKPTQKLVDLMNDKLTDPYDSPF